METTAESIPTGARAPRYQQLTELLAREIREGRYPVGSLLPPEPQLCQRFAVSRHTVREAVRLLCDQGLVSRHQGVGTKVRATQSEKRYVASLSSLRFAIGVEARSVVLVWSDNSSNETGFTIQRATNAAVVSTEKSTARARAGTGGAGRHGFPVGGLQDLGTRRRRRAHHRPCRAAPE